MGVKISGFQATEMMLENIMRRTTKRALRVMRRGADDIADLAAAQAPVDEGNLENSIVVAEDGGGINRRKRLFVYVDEDKPVPGRPGKTVGDYAAQMHEGPYNPGPESERKQSSQSEIVGPKFLERAVDELEDEIATAVEDAVKGSLF